MTMTLEQFRATGVDTSPLPADYQCGGDATNQTGGRVYCGALVIEDTRTWSQESQDYASGHGPAGRWYLIIGRSEYVDDDLAVLEGLLYNFAVEEGFSV